MKVFISYKNVILCTRGACDFTPRVTVCKFNKLILKDQQACTSYLPHWIDYGQLGVTIVMGPSCN